MQLRFSDSHKVYQLTRYFEIIGGIEVLPTDWQDDLTSVGLYHYLLAKVRKDEKAQLQKLLHSYVQKAYVQKCDRLVLQQPRRLAIFTLQHTRQKREGRAALLVAPTHASRTFSSQNRFCDHFLQDVWIPLPGVTAGSQQCPGCKAPIDEYGVHLLNCRKISTKATPDPFSRQMLHTVA